jgi:4-hydroxy-3-polyprenylbenzoate decarboxylase
VRPVIFLQFKPGAPRTEVWRALHGASGLRADCGKIVVAVSEDIDPTNTNAVFWAMAYRCNPVDDVHVMPHRSSGHGPKSGRVPNDSSLLIDATLKTPFPPLALPAREYMERARKIWDELRLPTLSPQPPWHGYTLGDWSDLWQTYADRAIAGAWEKSGQETLAQKRAGLMPETPVRDADKPDKSHN